MHENDACPKCNYSTLALMIDPPDEVAWTIPHRSEKEYLYCFDCDEKFPIGSDD